MVNVFVSLPNDGWVHALSIPLEEIWRLSLRPLKWLRYATFAVLGAKGHLLETPGGNIVDYENVSLADGDNYYFSAEGKRSCIPSYFPAEKLCQNRRLPPCRSRCAKPQQYRIIHPQ